MEETTTPSVEATAVAPMSFSEKLTNIFAAPGELYDNVRDTGPTMSNWLIPLIIFLVTTIAMTQVIMHTPTLLDQMKTQMREAGEKRMQEQVQAGKMTAEQAEMAREQMETYANPASPMFTVIQAVSMVIFVPLITFAICLVYWLAGKFVLKAAAPYMKVVEVVGLTFFIATLESLVTTIMAVVFDHMHASPSLALAVLSDFSSQNKVHLLLSKMNLFTFWSLLVTAIGLGRIFRTTTVKALIIVGVLWIAWVIISVLGGFALGG